MSENEICSGGICYRDVLRVEKFSSLVVYVLQILY